MAKTLQPSIIIAATGSTTDATSYATASVTPVSGAVYSFWVATVIAAGTPNTPTVTGTNGWNTTWTAIANVVQDQIKLTLFRGVAVSAVAGVLTADLAAQTNSAAMWGLVRWPNANDTINVQSTTLAVNAGTTLTFSPALAAFTGEFNGTYAVAATAGSFLTVRSVSTQGQMGQLPQASGSSGEVSACDFFSAGPVLAPQLAVSGAGSDIVGIAIEVASNMHYLGAATEVVTEPLVDAASAVLNAVSIDWSLRLTHEGDVVDSGTTSTAANGVLTLSGVNAPAGAAWLDVRRTDDDDFAAGYAVTVALA